MIYSVGVDSIFSTKYRLFWGEEEAAIGGPLGRAASLYDEGPEGPLFPSAPPSGGATKKWLSSLRSNNLSA